MASGEGALSPAPEDLRCIHAVEGHPSLLKHDESRTQSRGERDVVGRDEHSRVQSGQEMGQHGLSRRIKASGWFIEEKQPGRRNQRSCKRHTLLLTVGKMPMSSELRTSAALAEASPLDRPWRTSAKATSSMTRGNRI